MSALRFDRQVAIVTGAGGTIGGAYARALAARGARVVVNDIGLREPVCPGSDHQSAADLLVQEITRAGGSAVADQHDVVHQSSCVVETAIREFGRLDILINNAGRWDPEPLHADADRFNQTLDSHLLGTLNMTRSAWPFLKESGGRVIMTSSAGIFGGSKSTAYPIAKSGVFGSVIALKEAAEFDGITVNGVLPLAFSPMLDESMPEGEQKDRARLIVAEQLAPFILVLCHESVPIHGMCFDLGGNHASRIIYGHNEGIFAQEEKGYIEQLDTLIDCSSLSACESAADFMKWKHQVVFSNPYSLVSRSRPSAG